MIGLAIGLAIGLEIELAIVIGLAIGLGCRFLDLVLKTYSLDVVIWTRLVR